MEKEDLRQEMHTDCRVFYKDAKEDLKNFGRVD